MDRCTEDDCASVAPLIETATIHPPKYTGFRRYFVGWRFGIVSCLLSVAIAFIINLSFVASISSRTDFSHGVGVLFDGSCTKARNLDIGTHVIINAL